MQQVTHLNFSGFPGAGKTTITKRLGQEYPSIVIPKITTRPKRSTENGGEYIFTSKKEFRLRMSRDHFIAVESNIVDGIEHFYAIPQMQFWGPTSPDTKLILSAFGIYATDVKKYIPHMKLCFVTYKNMDILMKRLHERCLSDGSNFKEKMQVIQEYLEKQIENQYDHIVYNDGSIEDTIAQIVPLLKNGC